MLEALLKGQASAQEIASLAQRRAKQKIPEITAALEGHRLDDHHRKMIGFSLEHLEFLEKQIPRLDEEIAAKIQQLGYVQELELLQTVPGIQQTQTS
jgi:transposase